jgi:hypothetical protein
MSDERQADDSWEDLSLRFFRRFGGGDTQECNKEGSSRRQRNESRVQQLRRVLRQTLWLSQQKREG